MKKVISMFLVVMVLLGIVGCTTIAEETATDTATNVPSDEVVEDTTTTVPEETTTAEVTEDSTTTIPEATEASEDARLAICFEGNQYIEIYLDMTEYEKLFAHWGFNSLEGRELYLEGGEKILSTEAQFCVDGKADGATVFYKFLARDATATKIYTETGNIKGIITLPEGEIFKPGEITTFIDATEVANSNEEFVLLLSVAGQDRFVRFISESEDSSDTSLEELLASIGIETMMANPEETSASVETDTDVVTFEGATYRKLELDMALCEELMEETGMPFYFGKTITFTNGIVISNNCEDGMGGSFDVEQGDSTIYHVLFDSSGSETLLDVFPGEIVAILLSNGEVIYNDSPNREIVNPEVRNTDAYDILCVTEENEHYYAHFVVQLVSN